MSLLLRHDFQEQADWEQRRGWTRSPLGLIVPPKRYRQYDRPVAFDTFAGAGGFGCGFHQAGWHVAGATEWWETAAATYITNLARPGVRVYLDDEHLARGLTSRVDEAHVGTGWIANQPADHPGCEHFWLYDVRNLTGAQVLEALNLEPGELGCVTGGPPCQGFSTAGKRDVMDPRNSLIFEFGRLVLELAPKTFVMENVVGLLSMVTPEGIPVIDAFCHLLSDGGYAEYEALRRSLAGNHEAGAAVRNAGKSRKKKAKRGAEPVEVEPVDDDEMRLW